MKPKPWREIITPHDTVLQGTFLPSTFAADLSKVRGQDGTRRCFLLMITGGV